MIWRLLRKNISVGQIAGYAIANFIGLAIVLSAIRFYGDVSGALAGDDEGNGLISADYLVISKPVSMLNTIGGSAPSFSEDEINDILEQPWAVDAGEFSSANFNVNASLELGGRGISTFLFMESIPDNFIDIRPDRWKFDPEKGVAQEIPIILSKDYLALYNFGFAASRGMPQLTEGLISKVPITLQFAGNGHIDRFIGRIVGFSSRLNTIAVPDDFMTWANDRYATEPKGNPSRLIIKVNNPGNPQIDEFMDDHDYEVAGDKLESGRASFFLTLLTSIVIAIGAIISALAFFILMLSIFLLLQKNKDKISDLLQLGYSPQQVSASYYRMIGAINACVLILSIAAMFAASLYWEGKLKSLDIEASSPWPAITSGIVIMAAITAINFIAISRSVRRNF